MPNPYCKSSNKREPWAPVCKPEYIPSQADAYGLVAGSAVLADGSKSSGVSLKADGLGDGAKSRALAVAVAGAGTPNGRWVG